VKTRPPRSIVVFGAAKVNVGWRVGERRGDGYHDVCGCLQTISLMDSLEISVAEEGSGVQVTVPSHPELEGSRNLVHAAARAMAEHVDVPPTNIVVRKAIPVAAGLGGGSADAAAALMGLGIAWRAKLSVQDLLEIGAGIGSDVPALLLGGLVHVSGRGERVRRIGSFDDGWLVLGVGAEGVSTASAYEAFDRLEPQASESLQHNDLEAAAFELAPGLRDRVAAMREAAGVAFVSGSGPTVVGVTSDEAGARNAADRVRENFADVLLARPSGWGVRLKLGT
jgi:4-diphosphocytidyl-2-C-methyl-D-erythritol kinase